MKKKFGLVFEYMFDVHNDKDVAQVSKELSKSTGRSLWVYTRNRNYTLADKTVFYPKGISNSSNKLINNELYISLKPSIFFSLWGGYRSARDCDIIMVMHYGIGAFVTAATFKICKIFQGERGVVYSKADLGTKKIQRDNHLLKNSPLKFLFRILYYKLLPWAVDYLSVETAEGKRWFVNTLKRNEKNTFVVYNSPSSHPTSKVSFINRKKQIIFVGRVSAPEKGVNYLIEAFISLTKKYSDYSLVIVGPYDHDWLMLMEETFSVSSYNISFLGNIKDKGKLFQVYSDSRFFVLPSLFEGSPLSFVEAVSCNVIPICSDVSYVYREVLGAEADYCLFNSKHSEELAERLEFLINNTSVAKNIYDNITLISSKFNWNKQLVSVSKVLSD
jgi:glycosyltransferase involved in cell wall biosynthesis